MIQKICTSFVYAVLETINFFQGIIRRECVLVLGACFLFVSIEKAFGRA